MIIFYLQTVALTSPVLLEEITMTRDTNYLLSFNTPNILYLYASKDGSGSTRVLIEYLENGILKNISASLPLKHVHYYKKYNFSKCELTGVIYIEDLYADGVVDGVVVSLIAIDDSLQIQNFKSYSNRYYTTNHVYGGWPVGYIDVVRTGVEICFMYGN